MKRDLWLRLRAYHFENLVPLHMLDHVVAALGGGDASTRAFANKLARKLGWSSSFASRAIEEYRKFVYLGVVSDFSVTPPKVIDQVWHEHILFSRAYREFCRDVLQHDFDHNPELLPSDQQIERYEAQYHATLDLYRTEFNTTPPVAFWGTPKYDRDPHRKPATTARARASDEISASTGDSSPLYLQFDGHGDTPGHYDMPEFHGGGGFSGAGGGSDWDQASGGEAGGDSGGNSGGDSGGSSCSSGCGGD
jgi:hypothetical protein